MTAAVPDPGRRSVVLGIASLTIVGAAQAVAPECVLGPELAMPAVRSRPVVAIVVETFRTHGLYADRALLMRGSGDAGNSRLGAPSQLLGEALVDRLRAAYGYDVVLAPPARIDNALIIRMQGMRFTHLPAAAGSRAALAVEFAISGAGHAVPDRLAFSEAAAAGVTPADYVAAQAALVDQAGARLLALIDGLLPKVPL